MDFINKKVLVCGMAKSGITAAKLLHELGAVVTVTDIKPLEAFKGALSQLEQLNIKFALGGSPDTLVKEQDLLVISPGVPIDVPFLNLARSLGIPIWGEVELAYSLSKAPVYAITGTNGKTTTTALTGQIFFSHNKETKVVGNIGVPFCSKVQETPEEGCFVVEISSFQLESIVSFKPKVAAVLNITPDHINRHYTLENYIAMKERIFENQDETDYLVLNYDCGYCRDMAKRAKARVIFFSVQSLLIEGVYVKGEKIVANINGTTEEIINVNELQILGEHNVENALAAVAISICGGVPVEIIRQELRAFKGVEHRIEYVTTINDVDFYNDSKATNVDAALKALYAMKRPIVLIAGGRDKDLDFAPLIKLAKEKVRHIVLIGEAANKIEDVCKAYGFDSYERANSLRSAVELALAKSEQGECVLLAPACASFDMFDSYEQRGNMFKAFVHELSEGK